MWIGQFAPSLKSVPPGQCGHTRHAIATLTGELGRYADGVNDDTNLARMPNGRSAAAGKTSGTHRVRSALVSVLAGLLLATGATSGANASDGWCDTDPLLVITTPSGVPVPVYVDTGALGAEHLAAAQTAQMGYTAASVANGSATNVKVTVMVAPDAFSSSFATRSAVSTGAFRTGTIYAETTGYSGQLMKMEFVLPVP